MAEATTTKGTSWRTLLILGRVSNLPTVWSNCLAGWWLGGGAAIGSLLLLCLAASAFYVGGMYLNDAFDYSFDLEHRRERPIPSGAVAWRTVWRLGWSMLAGGLCLSFGLGWRATVLACLLTTSIVLYNAVHKKLVTSPILMAACRFFLFLMAAATSTGTITGLAVWTALALACYIVGLSYVAKFESVPGALRYWPVVTLAAPLLLAWLVNAGRYRTASIVLSILLLAWVLNCLRYTFGMVQPQYGRTVGGLLAGIPLVDLLAVCGAPGPVMASLLACFGLALWCQKHVPAT